MKKGKLIITFTLLILGLTTINKYTYSQTSDEIIAGLIGGTDMIELEKQHSKLQKELDPMLDYLATAVIANSLYRPTEGIEALDSLLNNEDYQEQLGFANICNLILMKSILYADNFQYKEAVEMLASFLEQTETYLSEDLKLAMWASYKHYKTLSLQPAVRIVKPKYDCKLNCNLVGPDTTKLLYIPCMVNGKNSKMIFDTGNPSFSLVSESFAIEYGIRKIADSIAVEGVGKEFGWLGIADSLNLGDIICYNPVFYVVESLLPPEAVEKGAPQIDAVLGSNLLFKIGEFQYFPKKKKMVFPFKKTPLPKTGHNLTMQSDRHQYIQAYWNEEPEQMHFDLGAAMTTMSNSFYLKNKSWVEKEGTKDTIRIAGYGGVSKQLVYTLPYIYLRIGHNSFEIKNIDVTTEKSFRVWEGDGLLGLDFISEYRKLTVSYENMFVKIEK